MRIMEQNKLRRNDRISTVADFFGDFNRRLGIILLEGCGRNFWRSEFARTLGSFIQVVRAIRVPDWWKICRQRNEVVKAFPVDFDSGMKLNLKKKQLSCEQVCLGPTWEKQWLL